MIDQVKKKMEEQNLTISGLSRMIDIDPSCLGKILRGKRNASVKNRVELNKFLKGEIDNVFYNRERFDSRVVAKS